MALTKVSSGTVKEQRMLVAEEINQNGTYLFIKRFIDILASLFGLILLSPIFLIVALLIKLEDPRGPILFKQVRIGKSEKEFGMYKFRSMVTDAEDRLKDLLQHNEVSGAMFKMKDDPRVTKIGKFIRKTSIDELPQLLNVLKGDMSLVGPRPPLPREVKEYTSYDKQRLLVTPGCTGLWQVTDRNSVGFKEMVELDLTYIKNRSLGLDIKLILKTVLVLFGSKNAF
ncbi:TPA: sugar transferase [Bacillus cereus]|mgnify:FL=1|uniref:sugar transferase n=1 Tax=Bacillus TaxID=1386 RepID=UPI000A302AF6|nr:sugar transferase [Bacillus cereus]MED2683239.1 sugar transferase [Bacillus thuringiensis]EKS7860879.1 sugar transferase [Bacillus cereus]MBL3738651.1 sugar transferase [Bacillus cereus]MBL3861244.1 sugar transferase [Bacillus cereus]MBR9667141.1 sugar transferase [Bacillus cereus]